MTNYEALEHAATRRLTSELTKGDIKLARSRQYLGCRNYVLGDISATAKCFNIRVMEGLQDVAPKLLKVRSSQPYSRPQKQCE